MHEREPDQFPKKLFRTSRVIAIFSAGVLLALVLLTVADVIMRRFFNAPIRGSHELTQIILGVSVFTALAFCGSIEGGHIEVDVVVNRFSRKTQKGIVAVMYFLTTVLLALMSWQLVLYAATVYEVHEVTAILAISPFPFISIAAFGVALLTLVFFTHFLANMVEVLKK